MLPVFSGFHLNNYLFTTQWEETQVIHHTGIQDLQETQRGLIGSLKWANTLTWEQDSLRGEKTHNIGAGAPHIMRPSMGGGLNLPISHFIFGQSPCSQIDAPAYFHNFPAPAPILDLNLPSLTSFLHNLPNLPLFSPNLPSPKYPIEGLYNGIILRRQKGRRKKWIDITSMDWHIKFDLQDFQHRSWNPAFHGNILGRQKRNPSRNHINSTQIRTFGIQNYSKKTVVSSLEGHEIQAFRILDQNYYLN